MVFLFPEEVDYQLGLADDRVTNENVLEARVARVHQFGPLDGGGSNGWTFLATADPWTQRPRF